MKVLNIDELAKTTRTLTIGGVTHDVVDMSVGNFIETNREAERLGEDAGISEHLEASIRMIVRSVPTLEEDQLRRLTLVQLGTILKFINGEMDKEEKKEDEQAEKEAPVKEGKGSKKK